MARRNISGERGRGQSEPRPPKIPLPDAKAARPRRTPLAKPGDPGLAPEARHQCIAEAAYFLAERRGFSEGCELDDWLQAEAEVDRRITGGAGG